MSYNKGTVNRKREKDMNVISNAMNILRTYNIPTQNHVLAVLHLKRDGDGVEIDDLQTEEYKSRIKELINSPVDITDHRHAKYSYLYLVQELVKVNSGVSDLVDLADILKEAMDKTKAFMEVNKAGWDSIDAKDDGVVRVRADGTIKPKKGGLKEQAEVVFADHFRHLTDKKEASALRKVIVKMFIDDVGLTEKGAPTYFYNCKSKWSKGDLILTEGGETKND